MTDRINPNIRSIIHILNNWNFTYDGSYVTANLNIHITKDELISIRDNLQNEIDDRRKNIKEITDDEVRSYVTAIADLNFAIQELDNSYGSNQQ
jgi:hypothetical protein